MTPQALEAAQAALVLAAWLALPVAVAGVVAAALSGLVQSVTAWQDAALGQVPRLLAVVAAWALTAPWVAAELTAFARLLWGPG